MTVDANKLRTPMPCLTKVWEGPLGETDGGCKRRSCGSALGDGVQEGLQSAPEHVEQQRREADVAVRERLRVVLLRHPQRFQPRLCAIAGKIRSETRCDICYTKRY